jgi:uncharacterized membrane protein
MFTAGLCGGWGAGGLLLMIGFWLLLIGVVLWAITRLFPRSDQRDLPEPDEELDHRLAAGDVDPTTYRRLRAELVDARASGPGEGANA